MDEVVGLVHEMIEVVHEMEVAGVHEVHGVNLVGLVKMELKMILLMMFFGDAVFHTSHCPHCQ